MTLSEPMAVMPLIYEIPLGVGWRWCKMGDVCEIAQDIARVCRPDFEPTIPELIRRFANLVKPNQQLPEGNGKRFFRYSTDGFSMEVREVPEGLPFDRVSFGLPIKGNTFVPEDWASDTLGMVRKGCKAIYISQESGVYGIRTDSYDNEIMVRP